MTKSRLNILFPGSFKPVHAGHMAFMDMYLKGDDEHDTEVYVLISGKDRDGITALSSLQFLNKIFGRFPNFHAIVTNESPIKTAYHINKSSIVTTFVNALLYSFCLRPNVVIRVLSMEIFGETSFLI